MNYSNYIEIPSTSVVQTTYGAGIAMGNRAAVFGKVGESNSMWAQFLHSIGKGWSVFDSSNRFLLPTTQYYRQLIARKDNSFADPSYATIRGATVRDQLRPYGELVNFAYYKAVLNLGLGVMVQYLDIVKPSVVVLMVGTNDADHDEDLATYSANFDTILSEHLSRNIVTLVTTIPPLHNGHDVEPYNDYMVSAARSLDLPIIHLYDALLTIPDEGIIEDAVHLTYFPDGNTANMTESGLKFGYNLRNYLTVGMLHEILTILALL